MIVPPGKELVGITLMSHIPYKGILRARKNPMQGYGQLNDAEIA
jgi:hypothetical protein